LKTFLNRKNQIQYFFSFLMNEEGFHHFCVSFFNKLSHNFSML